jgi:predicted amidohydrolase
MKPFHVAAVQMNALKDDLEHNLEVHRHFTRKAARGGCKLVLFPELSASAHYGDPKVTQFAEETGAGPISACMQELATENRIVISYGFCEKAHGTFYNAQCLVGPGGIIGVQRKVHASMDEYFCFRMGRSLEVFDLGFCKLGTLICYDSVFFEAWRTLALKGAEVILLPHAGRSGPDKRLRPARMRKDLGHCRPEATAAQCGLCRRQHRVRRVCQSMGIQRSQHSLRWRLHPGAGWRDTGKVRTVAGRHYQGAARSPRALRGPQRAQPYP